MAHKIDYSDDGLTARVLLDLNGASLDADVDEGARQFGSLKNALAYLPGPLLKRGAILNAGSNGSDINSPGLTNIFTALGYYSGTLRAGTTLRPYVGTSTTGATGAATTYRAHGAENSSLGLVNDNGLAVYPKSKLPVVDDMLVPCGRSPLDYATSEPLLSNPGIVRLYSGSALGASAVTGTGTFTAGSPSVTSMTNLTSLFEGAFIVNPSDSSETFTYYRIIKVEVSSSRILLDRPFGGSGVGAGVGYSAASSGFVSLPGFVATEAFKSTYAFGSVGASAWGRLVLGDVAYHDNPSNRMIRYRNRLRWSGLVGSPTDGTTPYVGVHAWSPTGYLDLDASFGEIHAIAPTRSSVAVFQDTGMTNLLGAPTYAGAGSLNATDIYPGVAINGGFAFESTPTGVYFFDKNVGPCLFDGNSVERIGDKRVTRTMMPCGIKHVGYYDGKVVFSGETLPGLFVFDTGSNSWSQFSCAKPITNLIAGRTENNEDLVGLYNGRRVVNLTNCFDNPGVAATDFDGEPVLLSLRTGRIGDPLQRLLPTSVSITYRLQDLTTTNPEFRVTVWTGLPNSQTVAQTYTTGATELAESNTTSAVWGTGNWGEVLWGDSGDLESKTVRLEALTISRGHTVQVEVQQIRGSGRADLFAVSVECDVEGEASS